MNLKRRCNRVGRILYENYKERLRSNQRWPYFFRTGAISRPKPKLTVTYALLTTATLVILIAAYLTFLESSNISEETVHQQSDIYGDSNGMEEWPKFHEMDMFAINTSRCVILLRESKGNLGNRMFMFANAYGLARIHACKMYVARHILNELEASFNIRIPHLISKVEMKVLTGVVSLRTVCTFFPELMKTDAIKYFELTGFWQSFKYFINYKSEVLEQFGFRSSILRSVIMLFFLWENQANSCCFGYCSTTLTDFNKTECPISQNFTLKIARIPMNIAYLKQYVSMSNFTWVGVYAEISRTYNRLLSSDTYIFNAMKYFSKRYQNCIFIVASNDKGYYRQIFSEEKNVIITPDHFSPSEDLAILALCQHSIITGGTLGWWSAFLGGGTVLHSVRHMQNRSDAYDCNSENYFPPWFLLST